MSAACRAAVRRAAEALGEAGHDVVESTPPGQAEVRAAFDVALLHETASGDGVEPRRPRGRALAADAGDVGGAARLRARRWRRTSRRSRGSCAWSARPTPGSSATAPPCARWRPTSRRRCAGASVPSTASRCAPAASSRCAPTRARSGCRRWRCRWRARRRAPGRRPAHRPPRPRAGAAGARARAGDGVRRLARSRRRLDRAVALDTPRGPRDGREVTEPPATQAPERRNLADADLTRAVEASFDGTPDPRLREILQSLVRHLHAFASEVALTEEEWFAGIDFLTRTGHITDDKRQEFILASDTLGLSMLVIGINHRHARPGPPSRPSSARSSSRARRPSRTATTSPTAPRARRAS